MVGSRGTPPSSTARRRRTTGPILTGLPLVADLVVSFEVSDVRLDSSTMCFAARSCVVQRNREMTSDSAPE